jgi:heat-inducible transcriptional repressor
MSFSIDELNQRSLEIFRELVDAYVETGEPVGSRTLSRRVKGNLSPATVRNIMADLEDAGLLYAPHTSAGRLPTSEGLQFFVHGLLEISEIPDNEKLQLEQRCQTVNQSASNILEEATCLLSGLSHCAGIVMVPKTDAILRHIEFVPLSQDKALLILVTQDGFVENRLLEIPSGVYASILTEASNYLNARLVGRTLRDVQSLVLDEMKNHQANLDVLTKKVIEAGLAVWAGGEQNSSLIVKGQANLLNGVSETEDLEKIRTLFQVLDTKENLHKLLEASVQADGMQIFIGAENNLFNLTGCSLVISPYHNDNNRIIGSIGVIGPTRMNYGKIIPLVNYTAKLVGRLLG